MMSRFNSYCSTVLALVLVAAFLVPFKAEAAKTYRDIKVDLNVPSVAGETSGDMVAIVVVDKRPLDQLE